MSTELVKREPDIEEIKEIEKIRRGKFQVSFDAEKMEVVVFAKSGRFMGREMRVNFAKMYKTTSRVAGLGIKILSLFK